MTVLIVDHEETPAHFIKSRLEAINVNAATVASKTEAQAYLAHHPEVRILFLDPAPLKQPRQLLIQLRQLVPSYIYTILMGPDVSDKEAREAGANTALTKPVTAIQAEKTIEAALRMLDIQKHLSDTQEDFPSGGGVIAKSAFCQLFDVAIDRADRYGEQAFILFIRLKNFNQIRVNDSDYAAQVVSAMLAKVVSQFHRQSDILGQTGKAEYALLLQRPTNDLEPSDAAIRFADMLTHHQGLLSSTQAPIELDIELIEIPSGRIISGHTVQVRPRDRL